MIENKKVIIILGPTAVGKSDLAVEIAKKIDGEIISADSSQVYYGFDIGSGKITKEEMQSIPHHLIDIFNYDQEFNVSLFKDMAEEKIENIKKRGKNPIICGGTGLYIKALVNGYNFYNTAKSEDLRQRYEQIAKEQGLETLFEMLQELDTEKAKSVDRFNKVRVIRALEIAEQGGKQIQIKPKFEYQIIVLDLPRDVLYNRINHRVDKMVQMGLFEEVQNLINKGANLTHSSFKSIGYKEVYEYLVNKTLTKEQAIDKIKQNSRKYAKRQLTLLRSLKDAIWIDNSNKSQAIEKILSVI